jgi:hypothetical protein
MTQAAVTADVHQSFRVQLNLAPQRTFNLQVRLNDGADCRDFFIIQVPDLLCAVDLCLFQDVQRCGMAYPVNIREADLGAFIFR